MLSNILSAVYLTSFTSIFVTKLESPGMCQHRVYCFIFSQKELSLPSFEYYNIVQRTLPPHCDLGLLALQVANPSRKPYSQHPPFCINTKGKIHEHPRKHHYFT